VRDALITERIRRDIGMFGFSKRKRLAQCSFSTICNAARSLPGDDIRAA
jgi:hypothetical protein